MVIVSFMPPYNIKKSQYFNWEVLKMRLTGGQIVAHSLINNDVPWVAGIPGHGCLALVDAFFEARSKLPLYLVRHEQSAAHMADGYYRGA